MKITDEVMAKALGWKKRLTRGLIMEVWCRPSDGKICNFPKWTTSLDAIVGEIEARGLKYSLSPDITGGSTYYAGISESWSYCDDVVFCDASAKTAPLALCHALLNYPKAEKGKHREK